MANKEKKQNNISHWITFAALIIGMGFGLLFPAVSLKISFLGNIYVGFLKLIIIPLLMCQVFSSAAKSGLQSGKTVGKSILLFAFLFAVSFVIVYFICSFLKPGNGFVLPADVWDGTVAEVETGNILSNIFTSNIFQAMANGKLLPCVLFALVCGIAASILKVKKAVEVVYDLSLVFSKVLNWIMYLTPIGVFSLMASCTASNGISVLATCAKYIVFAYGCSIIVLILVMILPLWIIKGINPVQYVKAMGKLWIVSLSTCSSMATLPTTMSVCKNDFHVSDELTNIVVPLGCTIHMCGGAVSFCLLAMFTSQAAGIAITFPMFLLMLVLAEIINMAAPGIPNGGIAIGAAYLTSLGLPLSFMGIYSGIYHILDMIYTTMNVTGDVSANILLSKKND